MSVDPDPDDPPADPPDDGVRAAEYALRLTEGEARLAFERRLRAEPDLRAAVAFWEARLAPLSDDQPPAAPPAGAKARLMSRIFGPAEPRAAAARAGRGGFWRGAGAATGLLTAAMVGLVIVAPDRPTPALLLGEIAAEDGALRVVAVYDPEAARLALSRVAGGAREGRALELWAIAPDSAPVSLGLLPEDGRAARPLPEALRDRVEALTLAVSDEPPGGSPTGAPTGDVLAAGGVRGL